MTHHPQLVAATQTPTAFTTLFKHNSFLSSYYLLIIF